MQTQTIQLRINGEIREAPAVESVAALLAWLDIASERVAVEMNKSIVRKRDWRKTGVPAGAEIEIVEFVGGG